MQKIVDELKSLTFEQLTFLNTAILNEIWIREQDTGKG
jgi:hypothetical protein